ARPVGVDVTPAQLSTARAMQRRFGIEFPLVEASAEDVPLRDGLFDLALSEYGASIWCDPYRWIPEASRLLRTEGRLIFLCNSSIMMLTGDELGRVGDRLRRDTSGCTGSSGRTTTRWSSTSGTETGSASCGR